MQTVPSTTNSRLISCARVNSVDQNLDLQMDEPKTAGCQDIYTDKVSGSRISRPGLGKCLDRLEIGDTLLVWRLDRLRPFRLYDLVQVARALTRRFRLPAAHLSSSSLVPA